MGVFNEIDFIDTLKARKDKWSHWLINCCFLSCRLLRENRPNFPHLTGSAENLFEIDNVKWFNQNEKICITYANPCQSSCFLRPKIIGPSVFLTEYSAWIWYGCCSLKEIWIWFSYQLILFHLTILPSIRFEFIGGAEMVSPRGTKAFTKVDRL